MGVAREFFRRTGTAGPEESAGSQEVLIRRTAIDALEEYSADHAETVEELMCWPDLRFEKFYEAFQRRKIIEELTLRKIMTGSAVFGNPNYDGEDNQGKREAFIQALEESFREQVYDLYHPGRKEREDETMRNDPFFKPMYKALEERGVLGNE